MSTDAALTAVLPSARLHLSTSVLMAFVAALATWVPARRAIGSVNDRREQPRCLPGDRDINPRRSHPAAALVSSPIIDGAPR